MILKSNVQQNYVATTVHLTQRKIVKTLILHKLVLLAKYMVINNKHTATERGNVSCFNMIVNLVCTINNRIVSCNQCNTMTDLNQFNAELDIKTQKCEYHWHRHFTTTATGPSNKKNMTIKSDIQQNWVATTVHLTQRKIVKTLILHKLVLLAKYMVINILIQRSSIRLWTDTNISLSCCPQSVRFHISGQPASVLLTTCKASAASQNR
jgi:hypothetical protein